jgi:hypothetical protein
MLPARPSADAVFEHADTISLAAYLIVGVDRGNFQPDKQSVEEQSVEVNRWAGCV